jgi:hypothetical protein
MITHCPSVDGGMWDLICLDSSVYGCGTVAVCLSVHMSVTQVCHIVTWYNIVHHMFMLLTILGHYIIWPKNFTKLFQIRVSVHLKWPIDCVLDGNVSVDTKNVHFLPLVNQVK